jgi:tRNA splicing endonuclease
MKKNYNNARELLQEVFGNYINSNKELEVKDEIMKNIISEYGDEGLNISLFVKDCSISNWLPSEHFSKIYYDELKYVKDQYGLSLAEKNLLLSLAPYLMWETNLLVDEDNGQPLSQNELIDKLEINKTTMIEMLKAYMKRNYYVHLHIKRKSIL